MSYDTESGYIGHYVSPDIDRYFSEVHITLISNKVTELLDGVHPDGMRIKVPNETIRSVSYNVYNNNRWNVRDMTDTVIEVIYNQIKNEYSQIKINNKLNKWDIYFDGTKGLRQHPPLKMRENRVAPMQFVENRY
jgi:hypothetical protein